MTTIKSIQNGKAIPKDPKECLAKAVVMGCSKGQSDEFIFWALENTVSTTEFDAQDADSPGSWVARASGTVSIGKTRKKTDQFFDAKPYNFRVTYRNARDSMGLPTIKLDAFEFSQDAVVDVGAAAEAVVEE